MLVTDHLIFLELQKSGSTHIRMLLRQLLGGEGDERHNPVTPALLARGLPLVGGSRSPWDWYVSLFCFGCEQRGSLHQRLMRQTERAERRAARGAQPRPAPMPGQRSAFEARFTVNQWFEDAADPERFRDWLQAMCDPAHAFLLGRAAAASPLIRLGGLMTYRYCRLFLRDEGALPGWVDSVETLHAHARGAFLLNYQIEQARLVEELLGVLRALGVPVSAAQEADIRATRPQNTSTRPLPVAAYYDDASSALVAERERFIIERHGYTPPR